MWDSADRAHLPRCGVPPIDLVSMSPAQIVYWWWHCKDASWDFVLCKSLYCLNFSFYNYILLGKRTACTCGRCLFLIKNLILHFVITPASPLRSQGWQSIAKGAILGRGSEDDHGVVWTQVWAEPLREQLTAVLVKLPSGPALFGHNGQNQFECLPAEAEVFLVFGVSESGRGKAGTGQGDPPPRDPKVSS